ncbi:porin family protein [Algoriphagus halophytocola]|uniref:PorT family protein n=1 Tax=Algoriphagus halophytocola TaxID=2991499 RepID=A0ABY6MNM4_9BACT|nr:MULTISPECIES: porin family protein [unclassified Algoriphagus]UZD24599.1 PorT family protein [Algoriphagus sp. TR-M5]WBL41967.1 porin family protein [Algoriphagus sp. TR-M9]
MKKLLILFFAIGLFSTAAHAQFGVRAGYSSPNFTDFASTDANPGFHVGAYYKFGAGFIALEPGIQYAQKGYKNNAAPGGATTERLNYIDVPVLLRLNFLPFLNVFAGPQGSVLVSRSYEEGGDTNTNTDGVKGYDIAGVAGVGANLPLGLNAQVSYDFGLQNLNYFGQDVKNNVFKISIGYDF